MSSGSGIGRGAIHSAELPDNRPNSAGKERNAAAKNRPARTSDRGTAAASTRRTNTSSRSEEAVDEGSASTSRESSRRKDVARAASTIGRDGKPHAETGIRRLKSSSETTTPRGNSEIASTSQSLTKEARGLGTSLPPVVKRSVRKQASQLMTAPNKKLPAATVQNKNKVTGTPEKQKQNHPISDSEATNMVVNALQHSSHCGCGWYEFKGSCGHLAKRQPIMCGKERSGIDITFCPSALDREGNPRRIKFEDRLQRVCQICQQRLRSTALVG
jgi:hypothetical protein